MIVHLTLKASTDSHVRVNPYFVLAQTARAILAPSCPHPQDQLPNDALEDYAFIHPGDFFHEKEEEPLDKISIFAVRGNDGLRMMILRALSMSALRGRVVVGGDSCLTCSLKLCRRANSRHLLC